MLHCSGKMAIHIIIITIIIIINSNIITIIIIMMNHSMRFGIRHMWLRFVLFKRFLSWEH